MKSGSQKVARVGSPEPLGEVRLFPQPCPEPRPRVRLKRGHRYATGNLLRLVVNGAAANGIDAVDDAGFRPIAFVAVAVDALGDLRVGHPLYFSAEAILAGREYREGMADRDFYGAILRAVQTALLETERELDGNARRWAEVRSRWAAE